METWLIQGVISGVIVNALTTIFSFTGNKSHEALQQLFIQDSKLDKSIKKAAASLANTIEFDDEQFQ